MLTLTDNARHAVQDIAVLAGLPEEGGLRIVETDAPGRFELSLVPAPVDGDEVIVADGARVFVESTTSSILADQTLDATPTPEGTGFLLAPQDDGLLDAPQGDATQDEPDAADGDRRG